MIPKAVKSRVAGVRFYQYKKYELIIVKTKQTNDSLSIIKSMIGDENNEEDGQDEEGDDSIEEDVEDDEEGDEGVTCNVEAYCAVVDCSKATAQTLCPEQCLGNFLLAIIFD